jgi:hypothetical protein
MESQCTTRSESAPIGANDIRRMDGERASERATRYFRQWHPKENGELEDSNWQMGPGFSTGSASVRLQSYVRGAQPAACPKGEGPASTV